jgi:RNase H-fold protein (predicted Holliday junction resolvase)
LATPFETYKRKGGNADVQYLVELIKTKNVNEIVCGLPMNMAGQEQEIAQKKKQDAENSMPVVTNQETETSISSAINEGVQGLFMQAVEKNKDKVQELTEKAVESELEIKNQEVDGRKKIKESEIKKNVTKAKTEEDAAKHERSQTILKSQGLTSQLPTIYRGTALVLGYPFYVLYLLTFGWVIQILTFVVKGFITMVADCAERFADVNKKFIDNNKEKPFNLGRAMVSILKWLLIVGAIIAVVVLLVIK